MQVRRLILSLVLFLLSSLCLHAQAGRDKVGFGLDYLALDLPDDLVFSPHIDYERKLAGRFFLSGKLGLVDFKGTDSFTQTIPESRKRIMLDIEGKIALLRFRENYLKLGVGPSVWYRNDEIVNRISFPLEDQTNVISYEKRHTTEVNLGAKVNGELDINVMKNMTLRGNFSFSHFKNAGTSSVLGLTALVGF